MITRLIILLNVLAFGWEIAVTHGVVIRGLPNAPTAVDQYMLVPAFVLQGHQYYRIVTSAFLHASILHIGMNMFSLYFVGRFIEAVTGSARTAIIYIVSLLASALAVVYLSGPYDGTLGASGAIFGEFGALFAVGIRLGERGRELVRANIAILIINLIWSFSSGISWQGHIGGLIAGFLTAYILYSPPKPVVAHVVDQQSGAHYESVLEEPSDAQQRY